MQARKKKNLTEDLSLVRLAELTDHSSTYLSKDFQRGKRNRLQ